MTGVAHLRRVPGARRPSSFAEEVHPAVKDLVRLVLENDLSEERVSEAAGLQTQTLRSWRRGLRRPTVDKLECALRVMGYRLAVVPVERK